MKISQAGIDLIKEFEGLRLQSYKCLVTEKYFTIGYGHYGPDVRFAQTITKDEAERLLKEDLEWVEAHVNKYQNKYNFNQNQFDALCSFTYNIGNIDQLTANGTRDIKTISEKMLLYNKSGGKVIQGLVNRRKKEQQLFLSGCSGALDRYIIAKPTLRRRCKSDNVKILQKNLNDHFDQHLVTDGIFGPLTQEAVRYMQEVLGVDNDSIYGPITAGAFERFLKEKGVNYVYHS